MTVFQKNLFPKLVLLLLCAAPLASDGQSAAVCCNLASSFTNSIFQGGNGDEEFFSVPGGPPNVMFLLDNSGSMRDLPRPLPLPAAGTGTCSGTWLDDNVGLRTNVPYDNGYTTNLLTDNPPWGLGRCTGSTCLFVGTSYYRHRAWNDSGATPTDSATACSGALPSVAACQACLDSRGYYVWNSGGNAQAAYKGDYLNGYPPKYVAARKVIKDLVSVDDSRPSPLDSVRFGLTIFDPDSGSCESLGNSLAACDGGQLVVPLGPNCSAYPMTNADQVAPRQAIVDAINNTTRVPFRGNTPLAESLFNIGQYFTSGGSPQFYTTLFGNGWTDNAFGETARGTITASWTGGSQNQKSICWPCQQSSIVILTDGQPTADNNLPKPGVAAHPALGTPPSGDFRAWSNGTINCPTCGTDGSNGAANLLHKVAYFLFQTDLRNDYTGAQNVVTYTVSFGLDPVANAAGFAVLQKTADLGQGKGPGGGIFANASSGADLNQALYNAITDVVSRATSFSNANTSTLQTAGRNQIFLTRFRPHSDPTWEGHVYRFQLFYEFAMGCDASKPNGQQPAVTCRMKSGATKALDANLNGDEAGGKAVCDGLFKLDADCDPVTEDLEGNFVKATFDPVTHLLVATATAADPFWDAGEVLSNPSQAGYRSAAESGADKRVIWTVVDTNLDGTFSPADGLTELVSANAATLAPLMQLDPGWCLNLLQRASLCGIGAAPACPTVAGWTAADTNQCARQIVHFTRGWDVLDQDGDACAGPGNPNNTGCGAGQDGEQRDRAEDSRQDRVFWKLGDVFHSSPVVVQPPVDEFTCDLGLETQCVATLHSPQSLTLAVQTPMDCPGATCDVNGNGSLDPGEDAYSMYRKNHLGRQQLLLVGANDGMLHAFDAGVPAGAVAGPFGYPYTPGTGAELWAFIPPDLLPKLKNALDAHEYFVDGDIMVRDVWYDANRDGRKRPDEFHTVAVMSERSGGSAFTALDVTDPLSPRMLWTFPGLCTVDVSLVGQSWTGFAPRPPPIGPVQLAGGPDPMGRGFEERWVVGVNGGYDPSLTRGKGVWLLDVWTGEVLWRFTNDTFQDSINPRGAMWPVAASPALVDLGKSRDATAQFDGFFDTLTWADIGGQIWVARLDPPGVVDAVTGRVGNWTAARAMEEQRQLDDSQLINGRSEFYFMPANAVDPATKFLHTYVGSGNREHILQVGAGCGPDNVLGCCQAGCNVVDVTTHLNFKGSSSCDVTQHFKCQGGTLTQDMTKIGNTPIVSAGSACDGLACAGVNGQVQMHLQCGAAGNPPDIIARIKCDANGNCCETIGDGTCVKVTKGKRLNPAKLTPATNHSRFYGVWSYGGARVFGTTSNFGTTLTEARSLDANRFTDTAFAGSCTGTAGGSCKLVETTQALVNASGGVTCGGGVTTCAATGYDAGWFYEYGQRCPLASCSPAPPWLDEKTGSAADVIAGCSVWNTFRPLGSGVSLAQPCTNQSGTPQNYNYVSNALTGVPDTKCGYAGATDIYRGSYRQSIAPPLAPTMLLAISGGKVQAAAGQPGDPGAPPPGGEKAKAMGGTRSLNQQGYWLEVPRDLHQCRHVDPTQCN